MLGGVVLPFHVKGFEEGTEFTRSELPRTTGRQIAESDWAEAHSAKTGEGDAHLLHHPPDDVIHPLVDDDLQNQAVARLPHDPELVGYDPAPVDHDAVPDPAQGLLVRPTHRQDVVLLGQLIARMHHSVGDVPVVGQKEQPFGVPVEAADRVDALTGRNQVHNGPPRSLVVGRGDVPSRLVEQYVPQGLGTEGLAVDDDVRGAGVNLCPELGHNGAVDRDATGLNQLLGLAPGADAAGGEDTLQEF